MPLSFFIAFSDKGEYQTKVIVFFINRLETENKIIFRHWILVWFLTEVLLPYFAGLKVFAAPSSPSVFKVALYER